MPILPYFCLRNTMIQIQVKTNHLAQKRESEKVCICIQETEKSLSVNHNARIILPTTMEDCMWVGRWSELGSQFLSSMALTLTIICGDAAS